MNPESSQEPDLTPELTAAEKDAALMQSLGKTEGYNPRTILWIADLASRFPTKLTHELDSDAGRYRQYSIADHRFGRLFIEAHKSRLVNRVQPTAEEEQTLRTMPSYREVRRPWNAQPNDKNTYNAYLLKRLFLIAELRSTSEASPGLYVVTDPDSDNGV